MLLYIEDQCGYFKNRWWRLKFRLRAAESLCHFEGGVFSMSVPVEIGGGKGELDISDGVGFGYWAAPMLGNGSILLEPRSCRSCIKIGQGTKLSNNVSIVSMNYIEIGKHCLIGAGVAFAGMYLIYIFLISWLVKYRHGFVWGNNALTLIAAGVFFVCMAFGTTWISDAVLRYSLGACIFIISCVWSLHGLFQLLGRDKVLGAVKRVLLRFRKNKYLTEVGCEVG